MISVAKTSGPQAIQEGNCFKQQLLWGLKASKLLGVNKINLLSYAVLVSIFKCYLILSCKQSFQKAENVLLHSVSRYRDICHCAFKVIIFSVPRVLPVCCWFLLHGNQLIPFNNKKAPLFHQEPHLPAEGRKFQSSNWVSKLCCKLEILGSF